MKLSLVLFATCSAKSTLIVGGSDAVAHSQPHIVSLRRSLTNSHYCGGSIVSASKGISASHCASNRASTATAGAHDFLSPNANEQSQSFTFTRHPAYNSNTIENDVAVLNFAGNFNLNQYVAPISIPSASFEFSSGQAIELCGWGTLYSGGPTPSVLQCVGVDFVPRNTCNMGSSYDGAITPGMFCAGVNGGGKDACQGDSGGPATTMEGGSRILAGATSWGYGCAQANYPGVYADLHYFRDWINTNAGL